MMVHDIVSHLALPMPASAAYSFMLLYISPDQILPLTSVLGAVVGALLIVWHRLADIVRRGWNWIRSRRSRTWNATPRDTATARTSQLSPALEEAGATEGREGNR